MLFFSQKKGGREAVLVMVVIFSHPLSLPPSLPPSLSPSLPPSLPLLLGLWSLIGGEQRRLLE